MCERKIGERKNEWKKIGDIIELNFVKISIYVNIIYMNRCKSGMCKFITKMGRESLDFRSIPVKSQNKKQHLHEMGAYN